MNFLFWFTLFVVDITACVYYRPSDGHYMSQFDFEREPVKLFSKSVVGQVEKAWNSLLQKGNSHFNPALDMAMVQTHAQTREPKIDPVGKRKNNPKLVL